MLRKFEVTNYKNFKDTLSFDFTKVHDYKYNEYCVKNDLINKAVIYGKNSVGKSNLGSALFDMVNDVFFARNPYYFRNNDHIYKNADSEDNECVKFFYSFLLADDIVDYEYKKTDVTKVVYEKFSINDKIIFSYDLLTDTKNFDNISDISADDLNWDKFFEVGNSSKDNDAASEIKPTALRYIIYNTVQSENSIIKRLSNFLNGMRFTTSMSVSHNVRINTSDYFDSDEKVKHFEKFLNEYGVKCNLILIENYDGKKELCFDYKKPLPFFGNISSGTLALTKFYFQYIAKSKPSFIFIDEFDAYYHFELSEKMVKLLENEFDCQVVLTSHNTNLLSNSIMRPDCFMILSNGKLTPLCEATDRELRQGHNLEKLYMSGEFNG